MKIREILTVLMLQTYADHLCIWSGEKRPEQEDPLRRLKMPTKQNHTSRKPEDFLTPLSPTRDLVQSSCIMDLKVT